MMHLVLLVLSVSAMAFTSNACQFGSEAIRAVYDRFELFKKTKAFDPADSTIPLEEYSYYNTGGEERLAVNINGVYISENYKTESDNKIQTQSGQYRVKDGVILNYKREDSGEFSFEDWSFGGKKFQSALRSIDAELPNDFEEDYKKVLVDLKAMRKKMFDYQKGLSKEDFERVRLFEVSAFPKGGFYARYIENDGGSLSVYQQHRNDNIYGILTCDHIDQKYNIVDGKVVVDGEPFTTVYH